MSSYDYCQNPTIPFYLGSPRSFTENRLEYKHQQHNTHSKIKGRHNNNQQSRLPWNHFQHQQSKINGGRVSIPHLAARQRAKKATWHSQRRTFKNYPREGNGWVQKWLVLPLLWNLPLKPFIIAAWVLLETFPKSSPNTICKAVNWMFFNQLTALCSTKVIFAETGRQWVPWGTHLNKK